MIKLSEIIIKDQDSIVEARNKIHRLTEDLGFDSTGAVKLATITSELSRIIYQKDKKESIIVGFDKREGEFGLILIFQSGKEKLSIDKAKNFFDSLQISRTRDKSLKVETFKYIPDEAFKPTKEFISIQRKKLLYFSREELFKEVQRNNKELKEYSEDLEDMVKMRTDELKIKTAELEKTNIHLEDSNRLKSVFLASMSHELRTPLNSIIGFTGIMLQELSGKLNKEQKKQLSMIKSSSNHLLSLINDLLDVSKIEANKLNIFLEEFKLDSAVREVLETFLPTISEKDLEIIVEVPEDISIFSDIRRVKQILINLMSNAVKFTDHGSIKVVVKSLEDKNLEIHIIDTGIGIKKEDIGKLFKKPFQQFGKPPAGGIEGTGLGLHLSGKLANILHGNISARSEFGRGSDFVFIVPLKYQGEQKDEKNINS